MLDAKNFRPLDVGSGSKRCIQKRGASANQSGDTDQLETEKPNVVPDSQRWRQTEFGGHSCTGSGPGDVEGRHSGRGLWAGRPDLETSHSPILPTRTCRSARFVEIFKILNM